MSTNNSPSYTVQILLRSSLQTTSKKDRHTKVLSENLNLGDKGDRNEVSFVHIHEPWTSDSHQVRRA